MNICVCGINHKTSDLKIRELLSFDAEEHLSALKKIKEVSFVDECVLVSTCNRTEVYIYSKNGNFEQETLEKTICRLKNLDMHEIKKYFYCYMQIKAVRHLFRVACSLDSLVLGEDQIMGQVKAAHEKALAAKTSKAIMNKLFRDAISSAKKVKTETGISKNHVSLGSVAVNLIVELFGKGINEKMVFVIGSGRMATITVKNLLSKAIKKISMTSRSPGYRSGKKEGFDFVQIVDYSDRYNFIDESDIIISSTTSPHYTITSELLEKALITTKKRVFIDLAVPRDIDSSIIQLPGVIYYNIDDLKSVADKNNGKRLFEAAKAEQIVDDLTLNFEKWYEFRKVLPIIKEIEEQVSGYVNKNTGNLLSKLKETSTEDKEIIKGKMLNLSKYLMQKFIYSFNESQNYKDIKSYLKCLSQATKNGRHN
ncbi:MAG: glutamyl-tRNA reductase [Candidatus Humimicrobiaceae bacterium]